MKRSGRKSAAQTPAPISERIKGSKRNPKGSAASSESANKINLSDNIINVLKEKADAYNEKHPKSKVSVATLKAVFRRGAGAYSSSHRPTISGGRPNSRTAWAYARVNKFLLKKGGTKVKAAYVQDDDLMERGGLIEALTTGIENLNKNGIVLKDKGDTITLIAYNTGNQERQSSLYNKALIYSSVKPIKSANEIIQSFDLQDFENFSEDKIEDYQKNHLTIINQNEVVYDSGNPDIRYEDGGQLSTSCKTYIANNESVLKTGYYLNLSDFSSMIDPYGQIPLNLNYTLVTYNSGNQDGLSLIDTINPINLQNELAEILNISINNAKVLVGLYIEMGKKLKSISQIEGDNIIVIDRDKVVCKSDSENEVFYDSNLYAEGGDLGQEITCVNCGHNWNTNQSDEFDKYICHNCGFDNRTYYDSDPIGKYHLGGDMSKHLAPNGKPSNLTHEQWHLVRTPEFKAWFGDWENDPQNASKVIDENGEPLVCYHYTENKFNIFKLKGISKGFFFTPNRIDKEFRFRGKRKIKCFLDIKKLSELSEMPYNQWSVPNYENEWIEKSKSGGANGIRFVREEDNKTIYVAYNSNQIKLADGSNTTFDGNNPDIRYEDGGKIFKPTLSVQDIARKHNVTVSEVLKKLTLGIEKELEHTEDEEVAKIIASHHVEENIEYYDVLKENELEEGAIIEDVVIEEKPKVALPDTYADVESLKGILAMQGYEIKPIVQGENEENEEIMKKGGVVVGKSHQESDENGTGEKFVVASTGQIVELEGGEAVIVNKAMDSSEMLNFEGKEMTPKEIASYLNHAYGGVKFEQGGEVTCGCSHKKYYHGGELPSAVVDGLQGGEAVITKKTMESNEKYMFEGQKLTPRQILSRINHKYGGVSFARGGITGRVKHSEENKMSKMIYFINNVNYG